MRTCVSIFIVSKTAEPQGQNQGDRVRAPPLGFQGSAERNRARGPKAHEGQKSWRSSNRNSDKSPKMLKKPTRKARLDTQGPSDHLTARILQTHKGLL